MTQRSVLPLLLALITASAFATVCYALLLPHHLLRLWQRTVRRDLGTRPVRQ